MKASSTILVPIDFSESCAAALALADALARERQARILALHVTVGPPLVTFGETDKSLQTPAGHRAALLERLHAFCSASSHGIVDHDVLVGDPADKIVQAALSRGCDLIVMGTHGRTGLRRLLLGSVAEGVLRKASCPVITLREPAVLPSAVPSSPPSPGTVCVG